MFQTCPFCHSQVSQFEWAAHIQQHQRLRPDGQMHDHVTTAPDKRYQGSLQGQPQWYVHSRCGGTTGMPEEVIRSYLADPFLYNDQSFCTGCQRYVPTDELFWQGTSQSLTEYTKQLRIDYITRNQLNPNDFDWGPSGPSRRRSRSNGLLIALAGMGLIGVVLFAGFIGLVMFVGSAARRAEPFPAPRANFRAAPPFEVQAHPIHHPREPFTPEFPAVPPPPAFPGNHASAEDWANENRRRMEQFQADMDRRNREMEQRMSEQREQMQRRIEELRNRAGR